MHITLTQAGRGRHHARLNDRLIATSRTPLFTAARVLIEEGVSPDEPLTMAHEGSETISFRTTVGAASRLTVQDDDDGCRFRPYRPGPGGHSE